MSARGRPHITGAIWVTTLKKVDFKLNTCKIEDENNCDEKKRSDQIVLIKYHQRVEVTFQRHRSPDPFLPHYASSHAVAIVTIQVDPGGSVSGPASFGVLIMPKHRRSSNDGDKFPARS